MMEFVGIDWITLELVGIIVVIAAKLIMDKKRN